MGLYNPVTPSDPNAIQKFSDAHIQASIENVLRDLPSGKSGALVVYADGDGIKGAIYGRKPQNLFGLFPAGEWTYVVTANRTWQGKLEGNAAVAYSW